MERSMILIKPGGEELIGFSLLAMGFTGKEAAQ